MVRKSVEQSSSDGNASERSEVALLMIDVINYARTIRIGPKPDEPRIESGYPPVD